MSGKIISVAFPVEFPSGHPVGHADSDGTEALNIKPPTLCPAVSALRLLPSFPSSININAYSPSHTSRDSRGAGGDDFVLPLPYSLPRSLRPCALSEQSGSSHESHPLVVTDSQGG